MTRPRRKLETVTLNRTCTAHISTKDLIALFIWDSVESEECIGFTITCRLHEKHVLRHIALLQCSITGWCDIICIGVVQLIGSDAKRHWLRKLRKTRAFFELNWFCFGLRLIRFWIWRLENVIQEFSLVILIVIRICRKSKCNVFFYCSNSGDIFEKTRKFGKYFLVENS